MNWIIYLICWIVNSDVIIGIPDFYNLFELEEELLWALGMQSNNQGKVFFDILHVVLNLKHTN